MRVGDAPWGDSLGKLRTAVWIVFVVVGGAISALPVVVYLLLAYCDWMIICNIWCFDYLLQTYLISALLFIVGTAYLGTDYHQQSDVKKANTIFCIVPFLTAVYLIMYGLFFGLTPDDVFIVLPGVVALHILRRAPETIMPTIPRDPSSFVDPGHQIDKSLLRKAEAALKKKKLRSFYTNLGKSMERALKHIEGARHRFSLTTRIRMWRTYFGGRLMSDLKAAERFFHADWLGVTESRLRQLWSSAHTARMERNKASHSNRKPFKKDGTQAIMSDVRELVLAFEKWRTERY
jgi:hypothetical protein